jgi:hypothetical protein
MARRIAQPIANLKTLIVDDIPKTLEFLETKNLNRRKGYYARYLRHEASTFFETIEKLPNFTRNWGVSTALMKPDLVAIPDGRFLEGYLFRIQSGPTMYDCGDNKQEYLKQANLAVWFFETGLSGELLAALKLNITIADILK